MRGRDPIDVGHETADVPVRPLLVSMALLVLMSAGAFWLVRTIFDAFLADVMSQEPAPHPMAGTRPRPEGPLLQPSPTADMRAYAAAQDAALSRYEWLDREGGVVRLPVERALELVLEEGLAGQVERPSGGKR